MNEWGGEERNQNGGFFFFLFEEEQVKTSDSTYDTSEDEQEQCSSLEGDGEAAQTAWLWEHQARGEKSARGMVKAASGAFNIRGTGQAWGGVARPVVVASEHRGYCGRRMPYDGACPDVSLAKAWVPRREPMATATFMVEDTEPAAATPSCFGPTLAHKGPRQRA